MQRREFLAATPLLTLPIPEGPDEPEIEVIDWDADDYERQCENYARWYETNKDVFQFVQQYVEACLSETITTTIDAPIEDLLSSYFLFGEAIVDHGNVLLPHKVEVRDELLTVNGGVALPQARRFVRRTRCWRSESRGVSVLRAYEGTLQLLDQHLNPADEVHFVRGPLWGAVVAIEARHVMRLIQS